MNAPPRSARWSCSQGAVGSAEPSDYALHPDELRWYDFPALEPLCSTRRPGPPRVLGLDCEMVLTAEGPELARVSLVELCAGEARWPAARGELPWRARVLLDAFVRPEHPVVDLLTAVSGVTASDLAAAALSRDGARQRLRELLGADDILCGHDLANDLRALGVSHPRVIDTLVLYPHHEGPPAKRSLQSLALEHLGRAIQASGHSSVEDAGAALELARRCIEGRLGRLVWAPIPEGDEALVDEPTLDVVLDRLRLVPEQVRCVYLRGSRAVGYAGVRGDGSRSDWDFVIVTDDRVPRADVHLSYGNVEGVLYDEQTFLRLVRDHCIWALECIFAPASCVLLERIDLRAAFALHRARAPREVRDASLRRSVSYESGRKWSKAKRVMVEKGDGYGCRKSMFIALRFLCYGVEVARTGGIADLGAYNHLWERLRADPSATWPELHASFEPVYKQLRAAFRDETPKLPRYAGPRQGFAARGPRFAPDDPLSPVAPLGDDPDSSPLAAVRMLRSLDRGDPIAALSSLAAAFRLNVRQHGRSPNVVQLRYTPLSEPPDHPVVRECRGLILDAARGFRLLAYPFDRFFDLTERPPPPGFDWSTARVYPKLDGSLAILYWYEDAWHVASSRRPDASGLVGSRSPEGGLPLRELFWGIWKNLGYALPPPSEARRCFLFELTSRRHPILVRYADERLTLIGARDLDDLRELDPAAVASERGWECLSPCSLGALPGAAGGSPEQQLKAAALRLDASLQEGFVVQDAAFRRVKLKSPDYVRMTWMFPLCAARGSVGLRHLLSVLIAGEADEFLAYCPEHRAAFEEARARHDALLASIEAAYRDLRGAPDAKAFALGARRHRFSAVLFAMRSQGLSSLEALRRIPPRRLERWLARAPT